MARRADDRARAIERAGRVARERIGSGRVARDHQGVGEPVDHHRGEAIALAVHEADRIAVLGDRGAPSDGCGELTAQPRCVGQRGPAAQHADRDRAARLVDAMADDAVVAVDQP